MTAKAKKNKKTKLTQKERIKELEQIVKDFKKDIEKSKDKSLRLLAEFDNYKKRTINEKQELLKYSGKEIVKNMLSIFDDLEKIEEIDKKVKVSDIVDGVKLINKNITTLLKDQDIKKYKSLGEEFDPELHDAIHNEPGKRDNIVTKEFQPGYKYHDKVLRHSKVVVSKVKN